MDCLTVILCFIVLSLLGFYLATKWSLSYWKRRGIDYIEPEFLWGNVKMFIKGEISLGDQITRFYNEFKSRGLVGGGVYYPFRPIFLAVDIELIKNIYQRDFDHFVNHGWYYNEEHDPLSAHLFNLEDERWKRLRAKLTPTFTSGKLKMMFPTIAACGNGLVDILREHSINENPADIKELISRYTTDSIGSCAFGIECNSLKNPDSEFRRQGKRNFEPDTLESIKLLGVLMLSRKLLTALRVKQTNSELEKFFMNVVKETVEYREKNNVQRKDFMHLLLQLKNSGQLTDNEAEEIKSNNTVKESDRITMNELAAQCFVFFFAGFETSASTMTFAMLELALNQDIQDKLRAEIFSVLKKYDGKLTYDAMMDMTYLNMVVHGARFGMLQAKIGIYNIIKNFKITLNSKTKRPIRYNTKNIVTNIDGDVWLNISEL